jgi:hypothetical protein
MAPTDTAVRNAKPNDKPYKLGDAQGLYLHRQEVWCGAVADQAKVRLHKQQDAKRLRCNAEFIRH